MRCAEKLISHGVGLLEHQWEMEQHYECVKVEVRKWLVLSKVLYTPSLIPRFIRTHVVSASDGILYCSCNYFERHGIPCRHQFCVLKSIPRYIEPIHHDLCICWWSDYQYKDISDEQDDPQLLKLFQIIEKNDTKGPSFSQADADTIVSRVHVPEKFYTFLNNTICSNYNIVGINQSNNVFGVGMQSTVGHNNATNFRKNFIQDESKSVQAETNSAWDELYPHFKDLVSSMEDEDDARETILEASEFMGKLALKLREKQAKKVMTTDNGKYVSINPPTEKKRKSHGTGW